jgi:hypothetical protein
MIHGQASTQLGPLAPKNTFGLVCPFAVSELSKSLVQFAKLPETFPLQCLKPIKSFSDKLLSGFVTMITFP